MTRVEREALELADRRCVGGYGLEHLHAWESLARRGLVRSVTSDRGAWYELTDAGRAALADQGAAGNPSTAAR